MKWIIEITNAAKTIILHEDQSSKERYQSTLERINTTTEVYLKVVDKDGALHWLSKEFLKNSCISFKELKYNDLSKLANMLP